ncbi:MAG: translation initiation factor IF-3 [Deltaproteobacteria bacterium]|nr:translation initiation factor IF-3 [Deltaproteobacteria bacterium]MBW2577610.1 translation initiation factor IF-3 [Deltaproteobacteria bacterium]MBW2691560.1 translation initiation factor IF-3 [Deltaproteobacteria bacterium]
MNELIISSEIRVIADDGEQLGVMTPSDALTRAQEVGLDLVEVAPGSKPPVCRIMDYGRYKYERKKKMGKNKGHTASLKEVKLRPRTDQHDLDFKLKNARRFLTDGDKVKVTVMYRGREMVHREFGYKQLKHVTELLSDIANVENPPRMEGRFLSMILVPNREAIAELARRESASEEVSEVEPVEAVEAELAAGVEAKQAAGDSGAAEAAEAENS